MAQIYSHGHKQYSVDMMFAYINIFGHDIVSLDIQDLHKNLKGKGWSNRKGSYSPLDVIAAPNRYKRDAKRIRRADLSYPIIVTSDKSVIDGYHRLTKAYLKKMPSIDAYIFPKSLMKKFRIHASIKQISKMKTFDFIELFFKRFENY